MLQVRIRQISRRTAGDSDARFLGNLGNSATVGYMFDLGNFAEVPHVGTKRRVCDERRQFLDNYNAVLGMEEDSRNAISAYLEDGLVSGPFS